LVTANDMNTAPTEFLFDLEVAEGTFVNLTWDNPTSFADGSPLDDSQLHGFEISYTHNEGAIVVDTVITGAGGSTTYTTPLLALGTYSFTVKVFDADMNLSADSNFLNAGLKN